MTSAGERNRVRVLMSRRMDVPGVVHGFSTRGGGVSRGPFNALNLGVGLGDEPRRVSINVARFLDRLGVPGFRLATVVQVHGNHIARVTRPPDQPFVPVEADGLMTDIPGWLLGVRTADCVPILMASDRAVAAVHAGWRGTAAGIVLQAVRAFETVFHVPPGALRVAIGPAIGAECYVVGPSVAGAVETVLDPVPGGTRGVVIREGGAAGERFRLDLKEANRRLLVHAGVPAEAIDILPHCVSCDARRFFSHRRDQGMTGRMLNVIGLTSGLDAAARHPGEISST